MTSGSPPHLSARLLQVRVEAQLFGEAEAARVGRYRLVRKAGEGAMGVVYEAHDDTLHRRVALKVIRSGRLGPTARARFLRESKSMARVADENVVTVFDAGEADGELYIAMEFVDGPTLSQWLRRESPSQREIASMFGAIGRGLDAAHRAGVVHRDFKPDNVLVDADGRPKVADFGLANVVVDDPTGSGQRVVQARGARLDRNTSTTDVVGTPQYAAPEVLAGRSASPLSDQFSFCAALFEALYQRVPFRGETLEALRASAAQGAIDWPRAPRVNALLRGAMQRGLDLNPARRWPSMRALSGTLGRGTPSRWRRLAAVGVPLATVAAIAALREPPVAPCAAGADLSSVWGPSQREDIRQTFARVDRSFAAEAALEVEAGLDAVAERWRSAYAVGCATPTNDQQRRDVTLACLGQARGELAQLVEVLRDADATTAARARQWVGALRDPGECNDSGAAPVPLEPELRDAVVLARGRVTRVRALHRAGRYDEARTDGEIVLSHARRLGYPALVAEAQAALGAALIEAELYPEALAHLESAYASATEDDRLLLAADVAARLSYVYVSLDRKEEAITWGRSAVATARRADSDAKVLIAMNALSSAYRNAERTQEARALLDEAEPLIARGGPERGYRRAVLRGERAAVHRALGEFDRARHDFREAIALVEASVGAQHPSAGVYAVQLGILELHLGHYEEALSYCDRATTILSEALGPDHALMRSALEARGLVLCQTGRVDEGRVDLERSLGLARKAHGAESSHVASVMTQLGSCWLNDGNYAEAARIYREGLAIAERSKGPATSLVGGLKVNLANALYGKGDNEGALRLYEDSLALTFERWGHDHPEASIAHSNVSVVLQSLRRLDEAAAHAKRALELSEQHYGAESGPVRIASVNAGSVEHDRGNFEEAVRLLSQAVRIGDTQLEPGEPRAVKAQLGLAEAHFELGQFDTARDLVHRVMATTDDDHEHRGAAVFLDARLLWASGQKAPARRLAREALARFERADADDAQRVHEWLELRTARRSRG